MGACTFIVTSATSDINQAFRELQEEATDMYGRDPYNGTIATCSRVKHVSGPANLGSATKKDIREYIDDRFDRMGKRDCEAFFWNGKWWFYGWAAE
jgi:hypothetical protein